MPRTSDHFPHSPQQPPSRPAPEVPASASSEPRPQESSSWSQQAFVSPSMSTTTTPIMSWMQAFTTPVQASSQHSVLYEQLQYPAAPQSTLSLLAGLTTPFERTEAFNYQTGLPPQQEQHPTRKYPFHEPLPSSMILSLPSPSYPQTPIPHRPLQKRSSRDEEETIPVTQELIAPLAFLSTDNKEEDGMSMTQELVTSPLAESAPKRKRKAPSSTKKKPSSPQEKRKIEKKPPPPPRLTQGLSEVDVVCLPRRNDHPGNHFYHQLIQEEARTLAQKQWKLDQKQNTKVESAGSQMEMLEIENKKTRSERLEVSRSIVEKIRQRDGQFLFRQKEGTAFYDIGDKGATCKTRKALQKAETAWLKKFLEPPPQEEVYSKTSPKKKRRKEGPELDKTRVKVVASFLNIPPRANESSDVDKTRVQIIASIVNIPPPLKTRVAPEISIPSPKKKQRESLESDKKLVEIVAGILTIPHPLEPPEYILDTRVAPQISIPSPLKAWNPKESPKLDKTFVKTVAGILNIPHPLEPPEFILDTRVAPQISITSPSKGWNPPSPAYDKEPTEFRKPSRCQEQEPYRLFVLPPQIPTETDLTKTDLPDTSAADFQLQLNPFFQRHYQESILLRPPRILTEGDLPEIGLLAFKDRCNFSPPAASLPVSKLSTRPDPRKPSRCQEQEPYRLFVPPPQIPTEINLPDSSNRLEPADFQLQLNPFFHRHYQESILLRPPQILTESDLPEIGLLALEDRNNFSPPAASLPVSKPSTRPDPKNLLEPIDFQLQYQRCYQKQLHPTDGDLPEIASPSAENLSCSNFSPAAASLPVSKLSTRPNSNNCLEPTEFLRNLFTQQHFTQNYQHDDDDAQDWFCAHDSR